MPRTPPRRAPPPSPTCVFRLREKDAAKIRALFHRAARQSGLRFSEWARTRLIWTARRELGQAPDVSTDAETPPPAGT